VGVWVGVCVCVFVSILIMLTSAYVDVLNLMRACADERSNADDMADILELVPETIRAAINAHLDSMNSLYPIRSVAASLHALIAKSQGWHRRI